MKSNIFSLVLVVMLCLITTGCAGNFYSTKQLEFAVEKALLQREAKLSREYMEKLTIVSGRLDGMSGAIVKGLTETLDTARISREIAEESMATSRENKKAYDRYIKDSATEQETNNVSENSSQFTPMEE